MNTSLLIDVTIAEICNGFYYNESEGKGLNGWGGKLVIQPEYQRNYLYAEAKMEEAVITSVLKEFPLGLLYFNKVDDDKYEVLDGQQRITSLGRFMTGKFSITDENGNPQYYSSLSPAMKTLFDNTTLTIYICEGTDNEIKDWFRIINIGGIKLKPQEISNAVYSGPFVTLAKAEFSNSQNTLVQKWSAFISGAVNRQDYLRTALEWVCKSPDTKDVEAYMSAHRYDDNINELVAYFTSVIDWASATFIEIVDEMQGRPWGEYYEKYHQNAYNPQEIQETFIKLYGDYYVKDKKGIFEYILGGCVDTKLLNVRIFDDVVKKSVYTKQKAKALEKHKSNCPMCAAENGVNKERIYTQSEMDADHVTAWSRGGATDISNCQMLCKTHNRMKGNR